MKYLATIQWLDNESTDQVVIKAGDFEELDDDDVFYYVEDESDLKHLMKKGVEDFIIMSYNKLKF